MTNFWNKVKSNLSKSSGLTAVGIGTYSSSIISTVFWLYIATLLGTENYGEVSYLISIATISSIISFLGLGNVLVVYVSQGVKIQSTIYFITLVSGTVTATVLFFIFHSASLSLYIIGYTIFGQATNELLGRKSYRAYSISQTVQKILLFGLGVAFYYLIGNEGIILGFAVSMLINIKTVYQGFKETKINFSLIKERFNFTMNSYASGVSRILVTNLDRLLIGPIFGFSILGNYQLGIQFFSLLILFPTTVYQYVLPHDAVQKTNKKLKVFTIGASVIFAILSIILLPIILPHLFPKFDKAVEITEIISLAIIPRTVTMMHMSTFIGNEKNKITLIGVIIHLAVQVVGIIGLGKIYGIYGIAAALVISEIIEASYLTAMNRYKFKEYI